MKLFRPSAATRWLNCPGSHFLATEESPSNEYAILGTAAHKLLEDQLKAGNYVVTGQPDVILVDDEVSNVTHVVEVDKTMVNSINLALGYIKGLTMGMDSFTLLTETRLEHPVIEGLGGTIDVLIHNGDTILVVDYKNGRSKVNADSDQLATYAVLARANYGDVTNISTHVVQPRSRVKEKVRYKEWTANELDKHDQRLFDGTMAANLVTLENVNENLETGGYCWYCPARQTCPAKLLEQAKRDFS